MWRSPLSFSLLSRKNRRPASVLGQVALSLEVLEDRSLMAVSLVSGTDPNLVADTPGGPSNQEAISDDGRYVVYTNSSLNPLDGITQSVPLSTNIFLYDRTLKQINLVNHTFASLTTTSVGTISEEQISGDGSTIAFVSTATDLVSGMTNPTGSKNIFLYKVSTGQITLATPAAQTGPPVGGDNDSFEPRFTSDGSIIAYLSDATDLVSGQVNPPGSGAQVFTYNTATATTTLISHFKSSPTFASNTASNGTSSDVSISSDGSIVCYLSTATDAADFGVTDNTTGGTGREVLLNIRQPLIPDSTILISHGSFAATFTTGNREADEPSMSRDGRYIVYSTDASDALGVPNNTGNDPFETKVMLSDWFTNTGYLVSHADSSNTLTVASTAPPAPANSSGPVISADGSFVAFTSAGVDVVAGQSGSSNSALFLWERATQNVELVDYLAGTPGTVAGGNAFNPALSIDGRYVAYLDDSFAIVAGSGFNGGANAYLYDRLTQTNVVVSHSSSSTTQLAQRPGGQFGPPTTGSVLLNGEGTTVIFSNDAQNGSDSPSNANGLNGYFNVYDYDIATQAVSTLSVRASSMPSVTPGQNSSISTTPAGATVSGDGRFYLFTSRAPNIPGGRNDVNYRNDLFLFDRDTGTSTLINHAAGQPNGFANASATDAVISADGLTVAFTSSATNMVAGVATAGSNVFLWDRATGTISLVSHSNTNFAQSANGPSDHPSISADGRYVAFHSTAFNLVVNQLVFGFPRENIYLFDRNSQSFTTSTTMVSHVQNSVQTEALGNSSNAVISQDGNWIAYVSDATNIVTGQTGPAGGFTNVFLYDRVKAITSLQANRLISGSAGSATKTGNGDSDSPSISDDGMRVLFRTDANDLVTGITDTNTASDVYLYDQSTGVNALVSHVGANPLRTADKASTLPILSHDGKSIAFQSLATNLAVGQSGTAGVKNLFLASGDTPDDAAVVISGQAGSATTTADGDSMAPTFSVDGRYVAFESLATNLVSGEMNPPTVTTPPSTPTKNIYLYDSQASTAPFVTPSVRLVSGANNSLTQVGNMDSSTPVIAGTGTTQNVVFNSKAYDLIPNDFNGWQDVFQSLVDLAPTTVNLSNAVVPDQSPAGTVVGALSTSDPTPGDTFTYTLVAGPGSADNASFTISGDTLILNTTADFAAKPAYSIRIRSTDAGGLFTEQTFTITVSQVPKPPSNIALSNNKVPETAAVGSTVGTFTTTDPNPGAPTLTYTLVPGAGSTDNTSFAISGDKLLTAAPFNFNTKSAYTIRVRSTNQFGLSVEKVFNIAITSVNQAPTGLTLSKTTVPEAQPAGTTVGTFSTTDPNPGNTFTDSLVSGPGSTDNVLFKINGAVLQTAAVFNVNAKSSYNIRVRTTDQSGLFFEQTFTIQVTPVPQAPTDIILSNSSIPQSSPIGTVVGTFVAPDPNASDTVTYSLVPGVGSNDNAAFSINGSALQTAALFTTAQTTFTIRVRATDSTGLFFEKVFAINVTSVPPSPPPPPVVVVRDTVGSFNPVTATWYLRNSNSSGNPDIPAFNFGAPGWEPVVGDWDNNGSPTIGVVDPTGASNPSNAVWYLRNSNNAGAPDITPFAFGVNTWIPVVGDWTGSGQTGIGMFDPTTATWYLHNSVGSGTPDSSFVFGVPGWIPVVGDWGGLGRTGIGAFDPSTGFWYLRNTATPGAVDYLPFGYGLPGWKPVTGDWGGIGRTGIAVVDLQGFWYLRNDPSAGPADQQGFPYGLGDWTPISGDWNYPLPLQAAGPVQPTSAPVLDPAVLQAVVSAALSRLQAAGASPQLLAQLGSASFVTASLSGNLLGLANKATQQVWIDADAAGYGWFTDVSAASDQAYTLAGMAKAGSAAAGKMDLLTTVLHEMGHLSGLADLEGPLGNDVMADMLPAGSRHTEHLDALFTAGLGGK